MAVAPAAQKAANKGIGGGIHLNYGGTRQSTMPTIPQMANFKSIAHSHSNFISADGSFSLKSGGLIQYCQNNIEDFIFDSANSNGNCKVFVAELRPNKKNAFGENATWFITIKYYLDTNDAVITHYGPFGEKTNRSLSKVS